MDKSLTLLSLYFSLSFPFHFPLCLYVCPSSQTLQMTFYNGWGALVVMASMSTLFLPSGLFSFFSLDPLYFSSFCTVLFYHLPLTFHTSMRPPSLSHLFPSSYSSILCHLSMPTPLFFPHTSLRSLLEIQAQVFLVFVYGSECNMQHNRTETE